MGPVRISQPDRISIPSMFTSISSTSYTVSIPAGSITVSALPNYNNYVTAWAPSTPPEPKLDAIKCPSCGQGNVKKTEIDGIVECVYCGRQFTLRY